MVAGPASGLLESIQSSRNEVYDGRRLVGLAHDGRAICEQMCACQRQHEAPTASRTDTFDRHLMKIVPSRHLSG
jgi:hypothetical protein